LLNEIASFTVLSYIAMVSRWPSLPLAFLHPSQPMVAEKNSLRLNNLSVKMRVQSFLALFKGLSYKRHILYVSCHIVKNRKFLKKSLQKLGFCISI